MDTRSTAPDARLRNEPRQSLRAKVQYPPDAASCASEVLAIIAYVTAPDGPLRTMPYPSAPITPWHERLLRKAAERLEVIDSSMRARVAFLVAGKDRGYYTPEAELELAGASLDAARAAAVVVDALLASRLPTPRQFDLLGATALRVNPAREALRTAEA